jgi:hypothetical protein
MIGYFIGNLDIFPWITLSDIIITNKLTQMWKIIGHCEVKHIMTLPIRTITLMLKVSTNIITSSPIGLAVILSDNVSLNPYNCLYSIYSTYSNLNVGGLF